MGDHFAGRLVRLLFPGESRLADHWWLSLHGYKRKGGKAGGKWLGGTASSIFKRSRH